jgi:acetyl-CoA carboxylase biotin carboxyl carrier protein
MELNEIRQLAGWLEASGMTSIEVGRPGQSLRLSAGGGGKAAGAAALPPAPPAPPAVAGPSPDVARAASAGIFLRAHPMRDRPFARAGDSVRQGSIVGLLRVGALVTPVLAPVAGTVAEPIAADGAVVGYGTPLVAIEPLAANP